MSFYYLDQNINGVNTPFENFGFNDNKFNFENFESMPPIDKQNSDNSYQCSDNVQITGNAIGSSIAGSTLSNCKTECKSEGSCVGFDFDNSSSSCTLKNSITDLSSIKQNNVMCVKKTSSACKVTPQTDPATEAERVMNSENTEQEQRSNPNGPLPPGVVAPPSGGMTNPPIQSEKTTNPLLSTPTPTKQIPQPTAPEKSGKCKSDTIFIDLPCFLSKMDVLKNHSDNLMIDLQLLITNLKSCGYVKKAAKKKSPSTNPFKPISESDDASFSSQQSENSSTVSNSNVPVIMPSQDTIKVYNSQASVLYTNNPSNNANILLGLTEPFENSEQPQSSFFASFTFKMIVLVLVVLLLMKI
jgi:hypothetical protein